MRNLLYTLNQTINAMREAGEYEAALKVVEARDMIFDEDGNVKPDLSGHVNEGPES